MPTPAPHRLPTRPRPAAARALAAAAGALVLCAPEALRGQAAPTSTATTATATAATATAACPSVPDGSALAAERGGVVVSVPGAEGEPAASFRAWDVDVRAEVAASEARRTARAVDARGAGGPAAEVRLTRVVGSGADAEPRLRAGGPRVPVLWLTYGDSTPSGAAPAPVPGALRVRLTNVTVAAHRVLFPAPTESLEEQGAGLAADVCQLAAERAEAARRLAELEALDRRKLAAAFELARLGDQIRVLDARLAAARRRLGLVAARLARAARPTEELTLRAERAEVQPEG